MQACVDWVLITFTTQVIKKKRPVWLVLPDYLSVSYDYGYSYRFFFCFFFVFVFFTFMIVFAIILAKKRDT